MSSSASQIKSTNKKTNNGLKSPFLLALFASAIILVGIITAIFSLKFGYKMGYNAAQNNAAVNGKMLFATAEEVQALNDEIKSLNEALDKAKQERDISLNNLMQLRENFENLEIRNLQLQQELDVYGKRLLKSNGLPLQIVGAKIEPLPENAFEYRFDVAMLAKDNKEHRLTPKLVLLDEESLVEVPLQPGYYDIKGIARLRGRFLMPKGFKPKQAKLQLRAGGQKIEQIYNWKLASPVDKMALSLDEVPETDKRPVTE